MTEVEKAGGNQQIANGAPKKNISQEKTQNSRTAAPKRTIVATNQNTPARKRIRLDLDTKLEIIALFENGAKFTKIAQDKKIPESSVRKIVKDKDQLRAQVKTFDNRKTSLPVSKYNGHEQWNGWKFWLHDILRI